MIKDDTVYLQHVFDAITIIQEYLLGVDEDRFKATRLLQDGVIRQIEIVGEAVRHLSKDIAGMRDKLIHDYFGVDIEKVWDTAQHDLPVLQEQVIEILKDYGRK